MTFWNSNKKPVPKFFLECIIDIWFSRGFSVDSDCGAGMWQIFRMALANMIGPLVAHPSGSKSSSVKRAM